MRHVKRIISFDFEVIRRHSIGQFGLVLALISGGILALGSQLLLTRCDLDSGRRTRLRLPLATYSAYLTHTAHLTSI